MNHGATFYEFFAGGGMARAGLGPRWSCLFANDFSEMKAQAYRGNWGADDLVCADIAKINTSDLPGIADLAWASFPCQDLSLAGNGKGLGEAVTGKLTRSGAFWPFWDLMRALVRQARAPRLIVLENVPGVLTSHEGQDFGALGAALADAGYRFGAMMMDARHFVPQSRQRVFFVAVRHGEAIADGLISEAAHPVWHPAALVSAHRSLSKQLRKDWVWWHLPVPPVRKSILADLLDDEPASVGWHTPFETTYLLDLMSPANLAKVELAMLAGHKQVGCIYRRTRPNAQGVRHSARKSGLIMLPGVCAHRAAVPAARRFWWSRVTGCARACCRSGKLRG